MEQCCRLEAREGNYSRYVFADMLYKPMLKTRQID